MSVATFAPTLTTCIISGYAVEGWNKISIARNTPVFRQIRGIRGKNTRVRVRDSSAMITFEVHQSSIVNSVFSLCLEQDEISESVRLEIVLTNDSNDIQFSTTTGYVVGYPEVVIDEGLNVMRWQLACEESNLFAGGATPATPGIVDNGLSRLKDFVSDTVNRVDDFIN